MLPRDHYLKQPFQDPIRFPNGFEKGGLSDIQARLIRKHGTLITALSIDEVADATAEDLHILKVIANQSAPKNPIEQAWIKYLAIVKNLAAANTGKGKTAKVKAAKGSIEEPVEPIATKQTPIDTPTATAATATAASKTKAKTEPVSLKKIVPPSPKKALTKTKPEPEPISKKVKAKAEPEPLPSKKTTKETKAKPEPVKPVKPGKTTPTKTASTKTTKSTATAKKPIPKK